MQGAASHGLGSQKRAWGVGMFIILDFPASLLIYLVSSQRAWWMGRAAWYQPGCACTPLGLLQRRKSQPC